MLDLIFFLIHMFCTHSHVNMRQSIPVYSKTKGLQHFWKVDFRMCRLECWSIQSKESLKDLVPVFLIGVQLVCQAPGAPLQQMCQTLIFSSAKGPSHAGTEKKLFKYYITAVFRVRMQY